MTLVLYDSSEKKKKEQKRKKNTVQMYNTLCPERECFLDPF